jgi:hypothetical protein
MPTNVNQNIQGRTDMVRALRELQAYLGQPVSKAIDDQAVGQQIIKLQRYMSTVPASTSSGFKFDPAKIESYIADHSLARAIIELQNAANTIDLSLFINLTLSTTARVAAGYSAMQAGTRDALWALNGSSVDRGTDESASPKGSQYRLSVAEFIAREMRADGIAAGANNWYGISGNNYADYRDRDDRILSTGSATAFVTAVPCQGGAELEFPTATGTFRFTPQENTSTAEIYYQDSTAGRSFSWSVDGGPATTITTTGLNTIAKATIPLGAVGPHVIELAWVAGFVRIYGIDCKDNTRKEITVRQWATAGGSVSSMNDNTGSPSSGRPRQIQLYTPDFMLGDIGLPNTWRAPAVSVATAKSQAEAYIDMLQAANVDFMFMVPPFDSGSAGNTANQQAYIDAVLDSCIAKGCSAFNLRAATNWTSKAASDAAGFTIASDALHKTIAGQANTAALLKPGLRFAMRA